MERIVNVDAIYRTRNVGKNIAKFAKKFPEAAEYCDFDRDCTDEEIMKSLPITDKYLADGTVNNEWTYFFDIEIDEDGMYIWFIKRA